MNDELINSAVQFLKDPNVASSPLTKKIEFLESKGLGQEDIEEALRRANGASTVSQTGSLTGGSSSQSTTQNASTAPSSANVPNLPIDYYNPPPPPDRSWKDYFIMATATAGVTYGLYQVATRYLIPSIIPPSQASIDQDKEKIDEEFIKIDKILEQLSEDQDQIKQANETKLKEIDVVIDNVNDFLSKYNKDKLKFDDDLRLMKLEIDNLSNSVEKNMALTKENIKEELSEISEELQSLKQLLKSRTGSQAATTETRKIPPVSSIPSASEILKRAKARSEEKVETKVPNAPTKEPVSAAPAAPDAAPVSPNPNEITPGVTFKGVSSAGIPAWQMKHKELEEAADSIGEAISTNGSSAEETVKKSIEKIGVPSWQLNSSTPSGSSTPAKDEAASSGIPAWQANSNA